MFTDGVSNNKYRSSSVEIIWTTFIKLQLMLTKPFHLLNKWFINYFIEQDKTIKYYIEYTKNKVL